MIGLREKGMKWEKERNKGQTKKDEGGRRAGEGRGRKGRSRPRKNVMKKYSEAQSDTCAQMACWTEREGDRLFAISWHT